MLSVCVCVLKLTTFADITQNQLYEYSCFFLTNIIVSVYITY